MSAKQKGNRFERDVTHDLRARGWQATRLSNSTGDEGDVWAVCPSEVAFIEAKAGGRAPAVDQWNRLYDAAMRAGAVPVVAMRRNGRVNGGDRIAYHRIIGRKTGQLGVPQPWEPWHADEAITKSREAA